MVGLLFEYQTGSGRGIQQVLIPEWWGFFLNLEWFKAKTGGFVLIPEWWGFFLNSVITEESLADGVLIPEWWGFFLNAKQAGIIDTNGKS